MPNGCPLLFSPGAGPPQHVQSDASHCRRHSNRLDILTPLLEPKNSTPAQDSPIGQLLFHDPEHVVPPAPLEEINSRPIDAEYPELHEWLPNQTDILTRHSLMGVTLYLT